MSKTVLVHIGMHKTGSSSIQASLKGYDDGTVFCAPFDEINHSIPLYTAFCDDPLAYHIWKNLGLAKEEVLARKNRYLKELSGMLGRADRQTLILSGEDIGMLSDSGKGRLLAFFAQHDVAVRMLCYVREARSYAASAAQELVKTGMVFEDLDTVRRYCLPNYRRFLKFFLDTLPPEAVTLRAYDRSSLLKNSVVYDFCDWAGINSSGIKIEISNEAQSLSATRAIHRFNQVQPVFSGDNITFSAYQKLVLLIGQTYAGSEKLDASSFNGIVDQNDLDWLESATGMAFGRSEDVDEKFSLIRHLADLTDVDAAKLDPVLCQFGITDVTKYDLSQKIVRVYLALLTQDVSVVHASNAEGIAAALAERDAMRIARDAALAECYAVSAAQKHATRYPWKYLSKALRMRLR